MKFEIAVEGPADLLKEVCRELGFGNGRNGEKRSPSISTGRPEARFVLTETEATVNSMLEQAAAVVDRVEKRAGVSDRIAFRVWNRAYAEPPAGGDRPRAPFHPVRSLSIQPWYPGLGTERPSGTILLDPNHAFGTGQHPTTRMCLQCLEDLAPDGIQGKRVLDFGCGSAILSLAASCMGAAAVIGVERDPTAAGAAVRNVDLNGWSDRIRIETGSWERVHGCFDLVLANLVPAALVLAEGSIHQHLEPEGLAVISGFGRARLDEMESFFVSTGLLPFRRLEEAGWGALIMARPE